MVYKINHQIYLKFVHMICKAIKLLISSEKMHKFKLFQFEYYISYIPLWSSSFKGDQDSHDHPALFNSAFQVTE